MSVTAKVIVTLEVTVSDSWGDDCTVAQVKKQAIESANGLIRKQLENTDKIKIVGNIEAVNIIYRS